MAQNPNIELLKTITPLRDVEKFYLNAASADVNFVCSSIDGDGEPVNIPAHKLILSSVSPIFHIMFYGPIKVEDNLTVTTVSSDVIFEFLKLFYLKNPTFAVEHVNAVVDLAKMYNCFEKETSTKSLETMKLGTVDQSTSVSLPENENTLPVINSELQELNEPTIPELDIRANNEKITKILKGLNDLRSKLYENVPIDELKPEENLGECSKSLSSDNLNIDMREDDIMTTLPGIENLTITTPDPDIKVSVSIGDDRREVSQKNEEMSNNFDDLYIGHDEISKSLRVHREKNTDITELMIDSDDDQCDPIDEVVPKENLPECSADTLDATEMSLEDDATWKYGQEWRLSPTESLAKHFPNQYVTYSSSVTTTMFSSTKPQNLHRIFFQRATDYSGKRDEIPAKIRIYSLKDVDRKLFIGNVHLENSRITVLEFKEPIPIAPNQQYCIIAYIPNSICFLSHVMNREPMARKNADVNIKFYAKTMQNALTGESITIQPSRGIATRLDFVEADEIIFREPPHSLNDFDVLHPDLYAHYLV